MASDNRVFTRRLNGNMLTLTVVAGAVLLIAMGSVMWGADFSVVSVVIFAGCVILTLWVLTMQVTLTVGADEVKVSTLGIFTERVPLESVDSVVIGPKTGIKEGAGLRFVDNDMGYLVGGDSVRIVRSRQSLLVSVDSPEEVIRAINDVKV